MTRRWKDSFVLAFAIITGIATVSTIIGVSMKDILSFSGFNCFIAIILRTVILVVVYVAVALLIFVIKGRKYKNKIKLKSGKNSVCVKEGDIFQEEAWRVIAFDTHFSTTVDDVVISKDSLHGKLVLEHGSAEGIDAVVKAEAERQRKRPDKNGIYTFNLGTAIHYEGSDGHYIMVAMTELDKDNVSKTNLAKYESTLMHMWTEIRRVYAGNAIALPLLGGGITDFIDGQDEPQNLLRCMICTLRTSKVHFKSGVRIVLYKNDDNDLALYEFKNIV